MPIRVSGTTRMRLAAGLLAAVTVSTSHCPAYSQQRDGQAPATLRERGELESAQMVELHNRVPGQTKLIFLETEGAIVKKGDVVARLETTGVEQRIARYRLEAAKARAALVQAEADLQSIKLDGELQLKTAQASWELATSEKDRLLGAEGELAVEQAVAASEIAIAKARLKTAEFLLARLDADPLRAAEMRLRMTEARESLQVAEARKRFLDGPLRKHKTIACELAIAEGAGKVERYTLQLKRSVDSATAEVAARQDALGQASMQLDRGEELLGHCQVLAPQDGMVVYPISQGSRLGGFEFGPGIVVREGAMLARVADVGRLQLKLLVDEAKIERIRFGQPVTVKIDAFPGRISKGKVTAVSAVPERTLTTGGDRRFAVVVSLDDPPSEAKLGLTATAEFNVGAERTE